MGIKSLMKTLDNEAPECYKMSNLKSFTGRTIAIDASMQLYQFMIQVRAQTDNGTLQQLTNDNGEVTSHLQGIFSRCIRLMEVGIRPVFVFDGKAPEMKSGELQKRRLMKEKANKDLQDANDKLADSANNEEAIMSINKNAKRSVHVTKEHNDEAKKLLKLMGIPFVEAPCEAEAQCAELCRKGLVYGVATEDMDTLTFGSPILLRNLGAKTKEPVVEINYDKMIKLLDLTPSQFIDFCILCGCDYCGTIKGIGPKRALTLIRQHKTIEKIIENIDTDKYPIPEGFSETLNDVRGLFVSPDVIPGEKIKIAFTSPNEEELINFLCVEKGFDEERIKNSLQKLKKAKVSSQQSRIDSFFTKKKVT